jgi:hypothetical protein
MAVRDNAGVMGTTAAAVDFTPIIGDLKGVVEVVTGQDLVSGERLGNWRWLGLAGISEVRHLRHADEIYDGVRQASAFLRSEGVSRDYRKQILESFEIETIRVRKATSEEFV